MTFSAYTWHVEVLTKTRKLITIFRVATLDHAKVAKERHKMKFGKTYLYIIYNTNDLEVSDKRT